MLASITLKSTDTVINNFLTGGFCLSWVGFLTEYCNFWGSVLHKEKTVPLYDNLNVRFPAPFLRNVWSYQSEINIEYLGLLFLGDVKKSNF